MKTKNLLLLFFLFSSPLISSWAADINQIMRGALKYYEKGDYDKALKQFVKVLRSDPNNAEAREYMLRCSQKIVETKLGTKATETIEKEIDIETQLQQMPPEEQPLLAYPFNSVFDTPSSSETSVTTLPATSSPSPSSVPSAVSDTVPPVPLPEVPATLAPLSTVPTIMENASENARSLLNERDVLADEMRRRYLGKGNIVHVEEKGSRFWVTLYMNRLFLPFSDVLRGDAYGILDQARALLKSNPKRKVVLQAVDNVTPAVRHRMADLPSRRCSVVFSYLIYTSFPETLKP